MGKIQLLENGISFLYKGSWKGISKGVKVKPETFRYVPKTDMSLNNDFPADVFVRTTNPIKPLKPVGLTKAEEKEIAKIIKIREKEMMKKLDLDISSKELRTLFSYEGEEYQQKALELLAEKMKMPLELRPQLVTAPNLNESFLMAYTPIDNCILLGTKNNLDKAWFLEFLRHELEHWRQLMNGFRLPEKGEKLVEFCIKEDVAIRCKAIEDVVKNKDIEFIKASYPEEAVNEFIAIKDMLKNNNISGYEQTMKNFEKFFLELALNKYKSFREAVIAKMGLLKADSKEAVRAKRMLNETFSNHYYKPNGEVDWGLYLCDCRENESLLAQSALRKRIKKVTDMQKIEFTTKQKNDVIDVERAKKKFIEEKDKQWHLDRSSYLVD